MDLLSVNSNGFDHDGVSGNGATIIVVTELEGIVEDESIEGLIECL